MNLYWGWLVSMFTSLKAKLRRIKYFILNYIFGEEAINIFFWIEKWNEEMIIHRSFLFRILYVPFRLQTNVYQFIYCIGEFVNTAKSTSLFLFARKIVFPHDVLILLSCLEQGKWSLMRMMITKHYFPLYFFSFLCILKHYASSLQIANTFIFLHNAKTYFHEMQHLISDT